MARRSKNFIQRAIKKPGTLRATAKRLGLIKGDEKLTTSDLQALRRHAEQTDDTTLKRRVNLAMTLSKIRKRK